MSSTKNIPAGQTPEASGATPLPEDRIDTFTTYSLAADLLTMRELFDGYFERVKGDAWARRTERRPQGWTLHQTIAHLEAVAEVYHNAILAGIAGREVHVAGMTSRGDLRAANRAAIDARIGRSPTDLVAAFLERLGETARLAGRLEPAILARRVAVPFFGGVPTVGELFGGTLSHAGIIHGGQVAAGARMQPIWAFFRPDMLRRQLTRFFHTMGLAYWPERGDGLQANLAFSAEGQGGGSWFLRVSPAGGQGELGAVRTADVSLRFASADLLCRVLTNQTRVWPHLLWRRIRVQGNLRLARRMLPLFSPT